MISTTRTRLAASAVAAAVIVSGGLLAAAPASAATGTLTLANSTFTAGDWGTGLDVSGTGFTADAVVTITVTNTEDSSVLDSHDVTADATGAFADEVFTPAVDLMLPADGADITVSATSDAGDASNTVALDVRAPKGIDANTTTVSTDDLTDPNVGVQIVASGYTPGETVTVSAVYNGTEMSDVTFTADRSGTVFAQLYLDGSAQAGQIEFTFTGVTSGVANSITITVTGDVVAGPAPAPAPADPSQTAPASTGENLPVVSG